MKKHKGTRKTLDGPADRMEVFARALRDALGERGVSRMELARRIGKSPSSVSNYTIGRDVPGPVTVFAIEEALGLSTGFLSRLLGFCPCGDVHRPPGVEEAILADPHLPLEHKKTLIGFYKGLAVAAVER